MDLPFRSRLEDDQTARPAAQSASATALQLPFRPLPVQSLDITNREVSTDDNTPSDSGEDDVEDTSEKNSDGGDNEDAEKKGDASTKIPQRKWRSKQRNKRYRASRRKAVEQSKELTGMVLAPRLHELVRIQAKREKKATKSLDNNNKNAKRINYLELKFSEFNQRRESGTKHYSRTLVMNQVRQDELLLRKAYQAGELALENSQEQLLGFQKRYNVLDQHIVLTGSEEKHHSEEDVWSILETAMGMSEAELDIDMYSNRYDPAIEKGSKPAKPSIFDRPTH